MITYHNYPCVCPGTESVFAEKEQFQTGGIHGYYGLSKSFDHQKSITEANVQAEFYYYARVHEMNCILEYSTPVGRLDIAVLNETATRLVCIIECKRIHRRNRETWQFFRYESLKLPVHLLNNISECEPLVLKIKAQGNQGMLLSDIQSATRFTRKRLNRKEKLIRTLDEDVNLRD